MKIKRMTVFNFGKFFKDTGCSLEEFAILVGYSYDGVRRMVERGTIKTALLSRIAEKYPTVYSYIKP